MRRQDRIALKANKPLRKNQQRLKQDNRRFFVKHGNKIANRFPGNEIQDCDFYTSNLCLNVVNYPKEQIIALLSGNNRRIGTDLVADVLDQSADQLIDGVTSAQENRYTFSHYYGNEQRREGTFIF